MDMKEKQLELSTQILIAEALKRDIKVEILSYDDNFIRLSNPNKVEYIMQATKTSLDTYIVPLIMENKKITKLLLKEKRINVPYGFEVKSIEEGKVYYSFFEGKDIVIKPNSTNFGKGITILMKKSLEEYEKALRFAFEYDEKVLIENHVQGKEYRFLIIGAEVAAILHRVPANVVGDGISNIKELVERKNDSPLRGVGYVTPLEKIQLGKIELDFIKKHGYTTESIPSKNQIVYLRENSNISTGGDSIDYTDIVMDAYKAIALQATKVVDAKICGLDMIIQNIHEKPNEKNYSIIELNYNPALHIHNYPYEGINRNVEKKVLDLLGF
ncbi:MAG: bifunctional glutamate--cysteine ligase GshA/glutathione synthetase GshB [Eubacteriales bacterium]